MKKRNPTRHSSERGIALLTVIMGLLLLSALTTAIILLAGRESYVMGRQRSSSNAFYAASGGLEQARAAMLFYSPKGFSSLATPVFMPNAVGKVIYIINAAPGETVNPIDLSASNPYADTEYQREFGAAVSTASVVTVQGSAVTPDGTGYVPYKWVRFTVKTERAANADINGDTVIDNTIPVYYDGKRQNLNSSGDQVYRLTALAVLPDQTRHMVQADISGKLSGFDYALAASGECEIEHVGTTALITGNAYCGSSLELTGALAIGGTLSTGGGITGTGAINLTTTTSQVQANGAVSVPVTNTAGVPPSVTSGPGTVTLQAAPSTPTPAPLPLNTLPNPSPAGLIAAVTQPDPMGTCVGGNVVFDLGNSVPPKVIEFTGATYMTACGTLLNPSNFPPGTQFLGTGTIWFSASPGGDIEFKNNFGTPTTPVDLNIVVRPRDGTVGTSEVEFGGAVNNIRGLIYVQGEVETEPKKVGLVSPACPVLPSQQFTLSGSMIVFGPEGGFEISDCSSNVGITYNPTQLLQVNPPPGFNGLLVFGVGSAKVINWRDIIL